MLNAVAFIGGNYLARYLHGDDLDAAQEEKVRLDKAMEDYQAAYATDAIDWTATNDRMKDQAKQNFIDTDYAFELYNQTHQNEPITAPKEPKFSDFYQPSERHKEDDLMFIGAGTLALWCAAFRFL